MYNQRAKILAYKDMNQRKVAETKARQRTKGS